LFESSVWYQQTEYAEQAKKLPALLTAVNFQLLICTGCRQYAQIHPQTSAISSVDFCAYSFTLPHSGI
jgi:hypothetical protein